MKKRKGRKPHRMRLEGCFPFTKYMKLHGYELVAHDTIKNTQQHILSHHKGTYEVIHIEEAKSIPTQV